MPTYTYECPVHGEFEWEHSITEELKSCPHCANDPLYATEPYPVQRLISGGTGFILSGSGWAKDSYSK